MLTHTQKKKKKKKKKMKPAYSRGGRSIGQPKANKKLGLR